MVCSSQKALTPRAAVAVEVAEPPALVVAVRLAVARRAVPVAVRLAVVARQVVPVVGPPAAVAPRVVAVRLPVAHPLARAPRRALAPLLGLEQARRLARPVRAQLVAPRPVAAALPGAQRVVLVAGVAAGSAWRPARRRLRLS